MNLIAFPSVSTFTFTLISKVLSRLKMHMQCQVTLCCTCGYLLPKNRREHLEYDGCWKRLALRRVSGVLQIYSDSASRPIDTRRGSNSSACTLYWRHSVALHCLFHLVSASAGGGVHLTWICPAPTATFCFRTSQSSGWACTHSAPHD